MKKNVYVYGISAVTSIKVIKFTTSKIWLVPIPCILIMEAKQKIDSAKFERCRMLLNFKRMFL